MSRGDELPRAGRRVSRRGIGAAFKSIYAPEHSSVAQFDALIDKLKAEPGRDQQP